MAGNEFYPKKVRPGGSLNGRDMRLILDSIQARFPIDKCDIGSVYSNAIDWTDGGLVPSENINVDELFNNATGIAAALGCLDALTGLALVYIDGDTIGVEPGHVLHNGRFKRLSCTDPNVPFETFDTATNIAVDDCQPTEGNPSGLDSDQWYYVYADLGVGGTAPRIRISEAVPLRCDGKGWEHPTLANYRFIGSIRTMATGVVRPFVKYENGWTFWSFGTANDDYQSTGRCELGRAIGVTSGGFVRYSTTATGSAYHDGPKHIPPTADAARVATGDNTTSGPATTIKPWDGVGAGMQTTSNSGDNACEFIVPVNHGDPADVDMQTFLWSSNSGHAIDVAGYHENLE